MMTPGLAQAMGSLEEQSGWEGVNHEHTISPELRIQLSIAISLKRIADAFEPCSVELRNGSHFIQMGNIND